MKTSLWTALLFCFSTATFSSASFAAIAPQPDVSSLLHATYIIDGPFSTGTLPALHSYEVWVDAMGTAWLNLDGVITQKRTFDPQSLRTLIGSIPLATTLQTCALPDRTVLNYADSFVTVQALTADGMRMQLELNDHGSYYCNPTSEATDVVKVVEGLL